MTDPYAKLNETFGLPSIPIVSKESTKTEITTIDSETDIKTDYDRSRETLHNLLDKGNDALDYMMDIAKASESPRTFEVLGTMINTVAGTAKELIALQKHMKDMRKGSPEEAQNQQVIKQQNNIVFQGSTADLLKQLNNPRVIDHEEIQRD